MAVASKEQIFLFIVYTLLFRINLLKAAICPLYKHIICNTNIDARKCLCAMSLDGSPPPEQSCGLILDKNVVDSDNFEAISITFRLDNVSDTQFDFPEKMFRQEIAKHMTRDEKSIVFLRLRCSNVDDDGSEITAQLVVLKHGRNPAVPFKASDLFDTRVAVKRIDKLTKIAGLEVTGIDKVKELYAVESYTNNMNLIIEACLAAIFIFATCVCGCWIACKNKGNTYDDELQKV